MPASPEIILGWDIGGAHLKAARLQTDGRVDGIWQEACPLWRGLDHLHAALDRILSQNPAVAWHAVTMTGEMTDLFPSRKAGVHALVDLLWQRLGDQLLDDKRLSFYAGAAGWFDAAGAKLNAEAIASANWHATAAMAAKQLGEALLADIGSTTCDIIPLSAHAAATHSASDSDRLANGELVYTGVVRTPVMALTNEAPVAGRWTPLMAEHFATSADLYRLLGWLPEAADQHDSADAGPKTIAASQIRLARMVGRDADELTPAAWRELAAWLADAQLDRIVRACRQVQSRVLLAQDAPLVMAGVGSFLGPRLAARLGRPLLNFAQLLPPGSAAEHSDWCAPAVAVGWLLAERITRKGS